jgi:TRAP-type C4-dicarboxylate transport system permease small subunit
LVLSACVIYQIFGRYVVGYSPSWTEELSRYCFVWMVFLGVSEAVKSNQHIKIVFLEYLFPEKRRYLIQAASNGAFIAFSLILVFYGAREVLSFIEFPQLSPSMRIPVTLLYLALPVGMSFTIVRLVIHTYTIIRKGSGL